VMRRGETAYANPEAGKSVLACSGYGR
jgi:hypothetical protein